MGGTTTAAPTAMSVAGAVVFDPRVPDPMPEDDDLFDPYVEYENGLHRVDFEPFFGGPVAPDVSTTAFGGGVSFYNEVVGYGIEGDSVYIAFTPRLTHGSISMHGRVAGDSIVGRWEVNAYARGATGRFVMHRTADDGDTEALVRAGALSYEAELREGLKEADGWGLVRLRTLDRGQARLVAARYRLMSMDSLAIPTAVASAGGGAGVRVPLEAGEYALTLIAFSCGGRLFHVDPATREHDLPTQSIRVRDGRVTTREVAIDSRRIRTTASFENRGAERCR